MTTTTLQSAGTQKPLFSPGCFGSAHGFKQDETCGTCDFRDQCRPVHLIAKMEFAAWEEENWFKFHKGHDAMRKRKERASEKGGAVVSMTRAVSRPDLSGMTAEEKAAHKKEQTRLRVARHRAEKAKQKEMEKDPTFGMF